MIAALIACAWLAAGEPPLTEARAAARAVEASAAVAALEHGVDASRARERAAAAWRNPELRLQVGRSEPGREDDRVALRWSPPGLGEIAARRADAAVRTAGAAADRELSRRDVAARARGLHATAVSLDAQLALARAELAERERMSATVLRRMEAGEATAAGASAAELDRLDVAAGVQALELRRGQAVADLADLLELPEGTSMGLSAEGGTRCAAPDGALLRRGARDPRRDVLRAGQRAAEAALARDRLGLLPWPTFLQAGYASERPGHAGAWTFQLGVELPLLDLGRAARGADAAERARVEDELRAQARADAAALRRALAAVALEAAEAARHRAAAETLAAAVDRYAQHPEVADSLEAVQLRARLLAVRRAALRAELECALERIEAGRLSGE